ncbi:VOC family protein [Tropicimonas marinistellae]|uniref:VOC family protein n=1 Tax=Tropicimonas marinistellae TaxID=1739787 RepID=UPI0008361DB0|nr:VOC family protein [Tropicimonas marinistellae]
MTDRDNRRRGPRVTALDHLVLTVADIDRTVRFYSEVLGMEPTRFRTADGSERMALIFGQQKINLHVAHAPFEPKAQRPTPGAADLCFLTDVPLEQWQRHLADLHVSVEEGPVRRTGASRPILSIYVRDPDGNLLEISQVL